MSYRNFNLPESAGSVAAFVNKGSACLALTVVGEKRISELRDLLRRGLNTNDRAPEWLFQFANALEIDPAPEPATRPITVTVVPNVPALTAAVEFLEKTATAKPVQDVLTVAPPTDEQIRNDIVAATSGYLRTLEPAKPTDEQIRRDMLGFGSIE